MSRLIDDPVVQDWIYGKPPADEVAWGKGLLGQKTSQFTTRVAERILEEVLVALGDNPRRPSDNVRCSNTNKVLLPDFIADSGVYEVKAKMYSSIGTAGEKILGTPIKYLDLPKAYNKPLYIVCMASQEVEADKVFNLFSPVGDLKRILDMYRNHYNIHYLKFTDLFEIAKRIESQ